MRCLLNAIGSGVVSARRAGHCAGSEKGEHKRGERSALQEQVGDGRSMTQEKCVDPLRLWNSAIKDYKVASWSDTCESAHTTPIHAGAKTTAVVEQLEQIGMVCRIGHADGMARPPGEDSKVWQTQQW